MRTLKKTLCLVLCLAMMVGLCAMGASAAFTDQDEIKSTEAVAVLNALGVITGYEDGSFRPNNELTRAEGAAIMTRLLAATATGTSSFTDMASAEWAQPYVAYCEAMGIIAGYGDGRFGPQDKLTVAAFAKMLLCALGYDAVREELVGNTWEIGVAKLVNQTGLAEKVDNLSYTAPITRDAAAQMAFNTLKATMVGYNGNGIAVAGGQLATPRENLQNTTYDYRTNLRARNNQGELVRVDNDGLMQFVENFFPTFKVVLAQEDDFGAPINKWFFGKDREDITFADDKLATEAITGTVMATYTTTVSRLNRGTLYTDGKWTGADGERLEIIENGTSLGAVARNQPAKNNTDGLWTSADLAANPAPQRGSGYAGATLLLLDTTGNGKADKLIVKYPYLAKVNKIVTAANNNVTHVRAVQLKVYNKFAGNNVEYDTEDFAANDWVLVYANGASIGDNGDGTIAATSNPDYAFGAHGADIISIEKITPVTGSLAKIGTAPPSLTVGDTLYSKGNATLAQFVAENPGLNKDVTVYLSNGYFIGSASASAAASEYIFLLGSSANQSSFGGGDTYTIGYLKQDATTATAASLTDYYNPKDEDGRPQPGAGVGWYTMIPQGSFYTFAGPAGILEEFDAETNATVSSASASIAAGITANDNTVFVLKYGTPVATYHAFTGIKNIPTFTNLAGVTAYGLINTVTGYAAAVYINIGAKDPTDATVDPIYLLGLAPTGKRQDAASGYTYYTYSVIKDGAATTIEANFDLTQYKYKVADPDDNTKQIEVALKAGLIIPAFDANGYLTAASNPTVGGKYPVVDLPNAALKYSAGVITVNGNPYVVTADTVAYIYTAASRSLAVGDASDLADLNGTVSMIYVSAQNTKVKTVYLIK